MIGDALVTSKRPIEWRAFLPDYAGHEEASWEQLYKEGLDRFFAGTFAGITRNRLVKEFDASLPEHPHWT